MRECRYDTYCGLYCGACEVMHAKTDKAKARFIRMFESNIPGWRAAPEQVRCSGCKTDDVFVNCTKCPIRPCAKSKGVEFCFECGDFPCQIYEHLKTATEQIPVLRHLKVIVKNHEYIRTHGVEKWLIAQKTKWECPRCGAPFAWYTEECAGCRHNLKGIKDYEI